jgi:UDP-2,4-diacetamido-2,4,6-trideoxy-beta-L-altropyranose hydrolase
MKPQLVIRADADIEIGSGHLMRCLALAQAWRDAGAEATFLTHCENPVLLKRLEAEGLAVVAIRDKSRITDPELVADFIRQKNSPKSAASWIALDGYNFHSDYQRALRATGYPLLVIDDSAHLPHYHANVLLNQNLYAVELDYPCNDDTSLLLGTGYALIRRELAERRATREIPETAHRILVSLGGSDQSNATARVIEAMQRCGIEQLEFRVVVGPNNPNVDALREAVGEARNIYLVTDANMPELMTWADIAVCAGGTTCWELACLGVPSVVVVLADNQLRNAQSLDTAGIAANLGWHDKISVAHLSRRIAELLHSPAQRQLMSRRGQETVDGKGPERVLNHMKKLSIKLREMSADECELVWTWAKDPETRASSFSNATIPWADHAKWFKGKIEDPHCLYYLARDWKGEAVGQIRYDLDGDQAIVSVSIDRNSRGSGYGAEIIKEASRKVLKESTVELINAYIKTSNVSSLRAFVSAGYKETGITEISGEPAHRLVLGK